MKKLFILFSTAFIIACNGAGDREKLSLSVNVVETLDGPEARWDAFFAYQPEFLAIGIEYPGSMVPGDTIYSWHGQGTIELNGRVPFTPDYPNYVLRGYASDNTGYEAYDEKEINP